MVHVRHQAEAIDVVVNGEHVGICTSTASGKSLSFAIPVFNKLLMDESSRASTIVLRLGLKGKIVNRNFSEHQIKYDIKLEDGRTISVPIHMAGGFFT
ncbi:DEAD/DEAH box helicase [Dethiobacter alkaliphilus]|uniref:DEAD/DEAH box helicase n=1 Tax=Dethiobacter alkaliphilus TaxID=427926 RepID=UPI002225D61E|nr:DEAD/DEAH box helicase [Dethiobacter alkaliphilus]MCW3490223.1 DEAD/DEAH box helicase [Dethiobacter alkaliphilus]